MSEEFYQFNINQLNGEEISLGKFKGKVILIVNTASYCGLYLSLHWTRKALPRTTKIDGLDNNWISMQPIW